jgi:hypothetical protein
LRVSADRLNSGSRTSIWIVRRASSSVGSFTIP